jgi:NAD(P)-dependent dehydrogenase (short-subunit alcohol dehydrogenase family)
MKIVGTPSAVSCPCKNAIFKGEIPMSDQLQGSKPVLERFRLDGRVALVTGGGQGIGQAFAHALGEAGAAVAVVDLNATGAETVADELSAKGIEAIAITADVSQAAQVQRMVNTIVGHWGRLTIGVNNAGIAGWYEAESMPEAEWDKMMALNLKGVFLCCQAQGWHMLQAGYGKIINTASMSGHIVNIPQNQAAYNISKAGVIHLTRSLAAEWAGRGVRVNSISPGYTRTQLVDQFIQQPVGKEKLPVWLQLTPMHRLGEVTDLQGAAVYLAAEVSDFMTGHDMIIDGGYCLW